MTFVDYSANFWGEKHIGYHVLYENLKKGEDTIQDFSNFVKERMGVEDDLQKFLHKSINRVNNYVSAGGAFVDSWRLTKSTLELWAETQASLLKKLTDLSKDVIKYHDDLVKSRKRDWEYDVLDAVNLMQTTTTCLQKAKETYHQRCTEAMNLKNEASTAKEFLKAKNNLTKTHDEYRAYVEKYNQVRDNFEEKMYKSTEIFQNHDSAHLQHTKDFFGVYARALDDAHGSVAQILLDYRRTLESTDVSSIMQRFVTEKGTGTRPPQPIVWTEADEIPAELEAYAASLTAAASRLAVADDNVEDSASDDDSAADLGGSSSTTAPAGGAAVADDNDEDSDSDNNRAADLGGSSSTTVPAGGAAVADDNDEDSDSDNNRAAASSTTVAAELCDFSPDDIDDDVASPAPQSPAGRAVATTSRESVRLAAKKKALAEQALAAPAPAMPAAKKARKKTKPKRKPTRPTQPTQPTQPTVAQQLAQLTAKIVRLEAELKEVKTDNLHLTARLRALGQNVD